MCLCVSSRSLDRVLLVTLTSFVVQIGGVARCPVLFGLFYYYLLFYIVLFVQDMYSWKPDNCLFVRVCVCVHNNLTCTVMMFCSIRFKCHSVLPRITCIIKTFPKFGSE